MDSLLIGAIFGTFISFLAVLAVIFRWLITGKWLGEK